MSDSLRAHVRISGRYSRSANLERDAANGIGDYLPTGRAREVTRRVAAGLRDADSGRAFSITGTYGSGKSSLALFLSALYGRPGEARQRAEDILSAIDPELLALVSEARSRQPGNALMVASATAAREPITRTLLRALRNGVAALPTGEHSSALAQRIAQASTTPSADELLDLIDNASANHSLLLIIDEFGKNIEEFLAAGSADADLYVLQRVAETTTRADRQPVTLMLLQHLSFTDYDPSGAHGREWTKIQGRFVDISYLESAPEAQNLMASAYDTTLELEAWALGQKSALDEAGLSDQMFTAVADLFPLHPLTAIILPGLCFRYGQNERTLFSFLAGPDAGAVPELLAALRVNAHVEHPLPTVRLHHVYDFFLSSAASMISASPHASRWIEIEARVRDAIDLAPGELRLLKAIGVLNLVSAGGAARASRGVLRYAAADGLPGTESAQAIDNMLTGLQSRGLITFREFADEYRIWHGSDFDFKPLVEEVRRSLSSDSPAKLVNRFRPQPPVVASRHSQENGVLRVFERCFADERDVPTMISAGLDGLVVFNLSTAAADLAHQDDLLRLSTTAPVLIGTPSTVPAIAAAAVDVAAHKAALARAEASPDADWVAVRELRERVAAASLTLDALLDEIYTGAHIQWTKLIDSASVPLADTSCRTLSSVLSELCDERYPNTPQVRNEMLSRRVLTSQGAKARRNLLEAMLNHTPEPSLRIDGYPPERAMYEAVLNRSGIHAERGGSLGFGRPVGKDPFGFGEAWDCIVDAFDDSYAAPLPVKQIYDRLMAPPLGMKDGTIPVILVAAMIARVEDVALYEDGSFVPRLDVPVMERLVRNPDLFSVRSYGIQGARKALVEHLAKELRATSRVPKNTRVSSVLTVVGPLIARVRALPESARKTRRLTEGTIRVRTALLNATEPDQLLFDALPTALGFPPVAAESVGQSSADFQGIVAGTIQALDELEAAHSSMLGAFIDVAAELVGATRASLRAELQRRFSGMRDNLADRSLIPVVFALTDNHLPDDEWPGYLAMATHGRTAEVWSDTDLDAAQRRLGEQVRTLRRLEALPAQVPLGQHAVLVGLTSPGGHDEHRVIWLDGSRKDRRDSLTRQVLDLAAERLGETGAEELLAALTLALLGRPDPIVNVGDGAADGEGAR